MPRLAGNRYEARFRRVLELSVRAPLTHLAPPVRFQATDDVADFHLSFSPCLTDLGFSCEGPSPGDDSSTEFAWPRLAKRLPQPARR